MPFQKGNQYGRGNKRARDFADMIRLATSEEIEPGKTKLRAIADTVVSLAIDGDLRAIREVADRLDGKPMQQIDMGSEVKRSVVDYSEEELLAIIASTYQMPEKDPDPVL